MVLDGGGGCGWWGGGISGAALLVVGVLGGDEDVAAAVGQVGGCRGFRLGEVGSEAGAGRLLLVRTRHGDGNRVGVRVRGPPRVQRRVREHRRRPRDDLLADAALREVVAVRTCSACAAHLADHRLWLTALLGN